MGLIDTKEENWHVGVLIGVSKQKHESPRFSIEWTDSGAHDNKEEVSMYDVKFLSDKRRRKDTRFFANVESLKYFL